jgi:predicted nucleotidyltransferase component of viral defense system
VITMRELIAWRDEVRWTRDAQVEQDLLLTRAMGAIFGDPFLREKVAMRGGTVLHKVHLTRAARYSEDIDLVLVGDRPAGDARRALRRVLGPLLGPPEVDVLGRLQLAMRNLVQPSRIIRQVYGFRPTVPPPPRERIKIEVNYSEATPCFPLVAQPYEPAAAALVPPVILRTYDLDEILATKLRALRQRAQGRDLFDLWHVWTEAVAGRTARPVDPDRVASALRFYLAREGAAPRRDDFERDLDAKLRDRGFRSDMQAVLSAGSVFDVDLAAGVVRQVFFSRLPG